MAKDPYIQENGTLKNKLGISDYETLKSAEKDITFAKFLNVSQTFSRKFDLSYIKDLHKHIFEDIFDWAGNFRNIPVYKEEVVIPGLSLDYSEPKNIEKELISCLDKINSTNWDLLSLEQKSITFTNYLAEFWRIHPFRDGNTRTTLTFATQFSKEHGFPMDLPFLLDNLTRKENENGKIIQYSIRDKFVLAALPKEYSPEPEHLNYLIHQSMVSGIQKNIQQLQSTLKSTDDNEER